MSADPDRQKEPSQRNVDLRLLNSLYNGWLMLGLSRLGPVPVGAVKIATAKVKIFSCTITLVSMSNPWLFSCVLFSFSCFLQESTIFPPRRSWTPQAATSAVTSQYARYQFCIIQYPLLTAWQASPVWRLAMACILLHRIPYPSEWRLCLKVWWASVQVDHIRQKVILLFTTLLAYDFHRVRATRV